MHQTGTASQRAKPDDRSIDQFAEATPHCFGSRPGWHWLRGASPGRTGDHAAGTISADATALVSIALHVNEAACDLIAQSIRHRELPASYHSYQMFTLTIINPQLDRLAYLGAKFLEERGYRAYPFPANLPHLLKPSADYPGGPGDISHKHVAVACGLGRIGWHTLLITPQFGTRQKLVTDRHERAARADPMYGGNSATPAAAGSSAPTRARPRPFPQIARGVSVLISEARRPNTRRSRAGDAAGDAAGC